MADLDALVDAILDGKPLRPDAVDLDDLLHWLADPAQARGASIARAVEARGRTVEEGRELAREWLDGVLFAGVDLGPHRVLGLEPGASDGRVRDRYRLLMRVYHPDRAVDDRGHDFAARINEAHRRIRSGASDDPRPGPRPSHPAVGRVRRRIRRRRRRRSPLRALGSARRVRRRVVLGLIGIGSASIVYAFVANRSWQELGTAPTPDVGAPAPGLGRSAP